MNKNKKSQKKEFNMYTFMNKHKKVVVGGISALLIASMLLSLFSQFAYM